MTFRWEGLPDCDLQVEVGLTFTSRWKGWPDYDLQLGGLV
jgi:hypothetical protein